MLISGTGTLLQALIDASRTPDYGVQLVAVGSDRPGVPGLARAEAAGIPTFVHSVADHPSRPDWDRALTKEVDGYAPDLVISARFLQFVGPSSCPPWAAGDQHSSGVAAVLPRVHGPRDALAYGVKISGATVFLVDAGVDTGVILAQAAVPVAEDDTVDTLHERIKVAERELLVDIIHRLATRRWRVEDRKVTWE